MKIKNTTFIQNHIEKMVLGAAALVLILVLAYYLCGVPDQPFGVSLDKKDEKKSIGSVSPIMKEQAEKLRRELSRPSRIDPEDFRPPNYSAILTNLRAVPVVAAGYGPVLGDYPLDNDAMKSGIVYNLAYYLPRPPLPIGGRLVTGNVVLASGQDKTYVSMEATFDQDAWSKRMRDEAKKHPKGEEVLTGFMRDQGLNLAGVYLERERWNPVSRTWGERQSIVSDGQVCYRESQPGWDPSLDNDKAMSLLKSIKDNQSIIRTPGFPPLDKASPEPILQVKEKSPSTATSTDNAGGWSVSDPKESKVLPALRVWSHDLSVEPGQKYHYRLIVNVVNPLYGVPSSPLNAAQVADNITRLALAPDAKEMAMTPWVEKNISANFYCFFIEASGNKAQFEVWKVVSGNWVTKTFEVKAGDDIGSATALVDFPGGDSRPVDLDSHKVLLDISEVPEPAHPERKVKAVLLMNATGQLEMRYSSVDANSPERQQVLDKSSGASGASDSADGAAPAPAATTRVR